MNEEFERSKAQSTDQPYAFVGATVITMRGSEVLPWHTVVVRDGCIQTLAPSDDCPPPPDVFCIDATGWFLLPGLADMHVHLLPVAEAPGAESTEESAAFRRGAEFLKVLLAHGVTTVRNMAGTPLHLKLRDAVRRGRIIGPRIWTAGPILETRFTFPELAQFGQLVRSPGEARAAVRAHASAGYDCIKVYNNLDPDVYDAIVLTARECGLPVVGHVAFSKGLHGALTAGQDSIEHFRAYDFALDARPSPSKDRFEGWLHTTPARMREIAERTAEAGTWNVPTLVVERAIAQDHGRVDVPAWIPEWLADALVTDDTRTFVPAPMIDTIHAGLDRRLEFVAALDRAGAGLMTGSDCPGCGLVPGASLHDELALFVAAGVSPLRALRAATADAAAFLGVGWELGTIAPGRLADLVATGSDPRASIDSLRDLRGVMAAGRWHPIGALRDGGGASTHGGERCTARNGLPESCR